ncbi:MAG: CPP1-like family protein [Microcoleaceae cyanobacterium]
MTEKSPYEQLGVGLDASFDEIQDARNRLREEHISEQKAVEQIEAAYDAILMDRLRMRQEGKIKVPERIRFPERLAPPPPSEPTTQSSQKPAWLERVLDNPSRNDILLPSGISLGLITMGLYPGVGISFLQVPLALGVGSCLYFLNRKENKFGRAVLLSIAGLVVGLILGSLLSSITPSIFTPEQMITTVTLLTLWLVSCFLR